MYWFYYFLTFSIGVFLSALFSGSETGFYRLVRVRVQLDAVGGNWISRRLLWLTNNPTFFVATTLVGNNLANYITSAAIVLTMANLFSSHQASAEIVGPIAISPFVFVYGELLPKYMFYLAPNRLLHLAGPLLVVFMVLFAPIAAILWLLGRFLQSIMGEAPESIQLRLAREELKHVFQEGHDAGILRPTQQQLVGGMFSVGNQPVGAACLPPTARQSPVRRSMSKAEILRLARRQQRQTILVTEPRTRRLEGYVRAIDVYLGKDDWTSHIRPLLRIPSSESQISALIKMQTAKQPMAEVVDQQGGTVGIISVRRLTDPLLGRK